MIMLTSETHLRRGARHGLAREYCEHRLCESISGAPAYEQKAFAEAEES
jgi:hypothetical protein